MRSVTTKLHREEIPKVWLPAIRRINSDTTLIDPKAIGNGNTQVAQVNVGQSNG